MGSDGGQLGVMTSREALDLARGQGLDLVLVAPNAVPPVAKVTDYGKHKYLEGKSGANKKKQTQDVKGIKISPRIADHDIEFLVKNATKFLEAGNKVKVTCMFRQRELAHPENGRARMDKFALMCDEISVVERPPNLDGRQMIMILMPRPGVKKKDAKDTNVQNSGEEIQDHGIGEDHSPEVGE
jgi:translation initiation factor IF-3